MTQLEQSVAIIDGTPLMRRGLSSFLSAHSKLKPSIEASSPEEALECLIDEPPAIIISEALFLGQEGVFELLQQLRSLELTIPVLVFSHVNERLIASRVLRAGASGYLMKSASEEALQTAISQILSGRVYLSDKMTERAIVTLSGPSPRTHRGGRIRDLTNREFEVLDLVGAGMTSKDIAQALHISLKTVESHRSHILAKLSLDSSAELICYATQWRSFAIHGGLTNKVTVSA